MRTHFADLLKEFAFEDSKVYVLSGDHGYALFDSLRKARPKQFINVGVSEQSMIGLAAGLAKGGLRPIVYGLACFIPIRVLEFIKMDVCYEALPVILIGDGAGLVYSTLGASHQCAEDIAVLNTLPNIKIYSPADAVELEYCFRRAIKDTTNASYIRLGKGDKPSVHDSAAKFDLINGCDEVHLSEGPVVVFATGSMVSTALEIAKELPIAVVSVPCLSDFSADAVETFARNHEVVITIEEHSLSGGLGSLVDQFLVERKMTKTVRHFGIGKFFTTIASSYEVALDEHGLGLEQLRAEFRKFI